MQAAIDLTNPDVPLDSPGLLLPGRSLRVARRLTVHGGQLYQLLVIEAFTQDPHALNLTLRFAADFVDVFEVRGHPRERRGVRLPARIGEAEAELGYRGLDDVVRTTTLAFSPAPDRLDATGADYRLLLKPGLSAEITVVASATSHPASVPIPLGYGEALRRRRAVTEPLDRGGTEVRTDHDLFAVWVARSRRDLRLLLTETPDGFVPYAGIPWYVAPFGRDALISALQVLPFEPALAAGTLRFFARHVGRVDDAFTDQEPGKIVHELRRGEMAACREIPFIPYFGSVDAPPLFVMLLAEYLRWTADTAFARELWPTAERVLAWMLANADAHRGYLTYLRRSSRGLTNQGWKDSLDAIMHADGRLAEAPIALAEAQGYFYAALLAAAGVAEAAGAPERAPELRQRAASPARAVRGGFLAARRGLLRAGARPRGRALPGDHLQRGTPAVDADGERQPRAHRRPPHDGRRHVHRLGHPHAGQRRAALQPDELPQRLGVASRHRDRRHRHAPLRSGAALPHAGHRSLRGGLADGAHADARALLRLPPRRGLRPHPVPGRVLAAGVGGRRRVHADRQHAGPVTRRRRESAHAQSSPPAGRGSRGSSCADSACATPA